MLVRVEVSGPLCSIVLRMALDTGATSTVISRARLIQAGYGPADAIGTVQMTTGSDVVPAVRILVLSVASLGQVMEKVTVIGHDLPPAASVDGVLGLDFFRGRHLELNFRKGEITLD